MQRVASAVRRAEAARGEPGDLLSTHADEKLPGVPASYKLVQQARAELVS